LFPIYQETTKLLLLKIQLYIFQQYDRGMLVLMCGVGKTLISLWITQKLNANTILIGVPNKLLLKQWEEVICILFQKRSIFNCFGWDR